MFQIVEYLFWTSRDVSDKGERNSLNSGCYGLSWTLCIMLNLILKIAVSIDYYKLSWTKGKGKNPNVRTILKRNILFQSWEMYQFGMKQALFFSLLFDHLMKAISMSMFSEPLSVPCLNNHSCNLPMVKYCCFPAYLQIFLKHEFDSLF